jgi:hypothetical protein
MPVQSLLRMLGTAQKDRDGERANAQFTALNFDAPGVPELMRTARGTTIVRRRRCVIPCWLKLASAKH